MRKILLLLAVTALAYCILNTDFGVPTAEIFNPEEAQFEQRTQNIVHYNYDDDLSYGRWGFNPWYSRFSDDNE